MATKTPGGGLVKGLKPKLAISSAVKKIDSPYAKYTSGGLLLSCSLCSTPIKSELFWTAHINGRQHRENIARTQKEKDKTKQIPDPVGVGGFKRPAAYEEGPPSKKKAEKSVPSDFFDKPVNGGQSSKIPPSSSAKPKSILKNRDEAVDATKKAAEAALISFTSGGAEMQMVSGGAFKDIEKTLKVVDTSIPLGFFDDPKLDAKARNIEYKDPKVEEWERFQKEMKELGTVSENIIEEDSEVATASRQLEEIDEQLHRWNRVLEFEIKKEELVPVAPTSGDVDMSSDEEEDNLDALLDWRLKATKLKR